MKTTHYLDPNTRVKFKFYPPALWFAMCLHLARLDQEMKEGEK